MKPQTIEFSLPEFSAFCLVGETVDDGARLLREKREREAAAADLERRQFSLFESPPVVTSKYLPPSDFVEIPTTHWLEVRAWRMPNGSKHVELIDETEETWEQYCAMLAKKNAETAARVVGKNR